MSNIFFCQASWTFIVEFQVQMLKMVLTPNDKESFKIFLDPDGDPDHPHNVTNCFLYHC